MDESTRRWDSKRTDISGRRNIKAEVQPPSRQEWRESVVQRSFATSCKTRAKARRLAAGAPSGTTPQRLVASVASSSAPAIFALLDHVLVR